MNIETKFGIGDTIHFIDERKITDMKVAEINVKVEENFDGQCLHPGDRRTITYSDFGRRTHVKEEEAYASKKELIEQMMKD